MNIAYLLLIHNTPHHTGRIIDKLDSGAARFFVHLDAKSDAQAFAGLQRERVQFTARRHDVRWGQISQVDAILELISTAVQAGPFDRYVLISGADYPLFHAGEIEDFFARHGDLEFINSVPLGSPSKPMSRITSYCPSAADPLPRKLFMKLWWKLGLTVPPRHIARVFAGLVPSGGSTWWALTHRGCDTILQFHRRQPQIYRFLVNSYCPDETYFQTILSNSELKGKIRRNLSFTYWIEGRANPEIITAEIFQRLKDGAFIDDSRLYGAGPVLFARKFQEGEETVLQAIDQSGAQTSADAAPGHIDSARWAIS
ncbi:beta-1,6-N-acetylglucosaminyltransferase [Herbaspirillum sp. NPDC087042]|uniref:beta-1,6-N-acetylglucosaminyltransferase n=1 Tax=Herbaspirillum sp. NPDC087042 TaxID=3364004 RepID=UPI0037FB79BF